MPTISYKNIIYIQTHISYIYICISIYRYARSILRTLLVPSLSSRPTTGCDRAVAPTASNWRSSFLRNRPWKDWWRCLAWSLSRQMMRYRIGDAIWCVYIYRDICRHMCNICIANIIWYKVRWDSWKRPSGNQRWHGNLWFQDDFTIKILHSARGSPIATFDGAGFH